jgi:DNA-binding transcriptional MerR regulator
MFESASVEPNSYKENNEGTVNTPLAPPSNIYTELNREDPLIKEMDKIPEKMNFKIGEVADIADVKPYVLRYWESEFKALNPKKSNKNQRVYSRRDVETVMMIKKLLHQDRFSIEGAKSALKQLKKESNRVKKIRLGHQKIEEAKNLTLDLIIDIQEMISKLPTTY